MTPQAPRTPGMSYRQMQLLQEVARTPHATQRDLAKRLGVALGLTNLLLRRLATKGYIKVVGSQRSHLAYLITPNGLLEQSRLAHEYLDYSLALYRSVRAWLRDHLAALAQQGHRRVVLCGAGELAELTGLALQDVGLTLAAVVAEPPAPPTVLHHPVRPFSILHDLAFDLILVASRERHADLYQRLVTFGVSEQKIITVLDQRSPVAGMAPAATATVPAARVTADEAEAVIA